MSERGEQRRDRPTRLFFVRAGAFFRYGLQEALSYRVAFVLRIGVAVVTLAALYFFGRFVDSGGGTRALAPYGGRYLGFGLVGIVLLNLQHAAISAYPRVIRQAQLVGTLDAMLATPTPSWQVLILAPIYRFAAAFFGAALSLVVAALLFGLDLSRANVPALLVTLPLCIGAFAAFGFFGATLAMLLRRSDPVSLLMGGLSALVGGVFYPTSVLPSALRSIGEALPITHALEAVRLAALDGRGVDVLSGRLGALALFCAIGLPLGLGAFALSVRRARRDGSLSHY